MVPLSPAILIVVRKVEYPLSAMFNLLHSISNQELFKKHLYNPHVPKERNGAAHPSYINYCLKSEVSITLHCRLCSRYTAVRIKNCSKSTSVIKIATMKNTDNFCYEGKPSCATAKLTLFAVSKDEWDTKEDIGKSMKNEECIVHTAVCQMAPLGPKQRRTVKKIKSVALVVVKLCLSEGISYSVSQ